MPLPDDIAVREAAADDLPGISRVRTSVTENLLTRAQLDERGITEASVAASFLADSKGWVAVRGDEIVAFSIADRASRWLTTGPGTRAASFYERRGWCATGTVPGGDIRYELRRPAPDA